MDIIVFLVVFACGVGTGLVVHQARVQAQPPPPASVYGSPELMYWFSLRAQETDPYWARLSLREYAKQKLAIQADDTR